MSEYKAPDINTLSAHEFNKIKESLDRFRATQIKPATGLDGRAANNRWHTTARAAAALREDYKSGKTYGVEDEYRYMVAREGFKPESMQISPDEPIITTQPVEDPEPGFVPEELPTDYDEPASTPAVESDPADDGPDFATIFGDQIKAMKDMFMQSMTQQQTHYQSMQQAQDERMAALQQQMQQAMIAQQQRPTVAGVQMAAGAAGSPMQIARRGVTGAFGRRGMRISSLNI